MTTPEPPIPISDDKLNDLWREACRDDWHLRIVGSDIRGLIAEVQRLRAQPTPDRDGLIEQLEALKRADYGDIKIALENIGVDKAIAIIKGEKL